MQRNLQRPRVIVVVVVFASSPDGYLLTIRMPRFGISYPPNVLER